MKIEKDISLAQYTTFRIGGTASYFCKVNSIEELSEALAFARSKKLPIYVLGGGSNVLFSDAGFTGLVIQVNLRGITTEKKADSVLVTSAAGEGWDNFVEFTVKEGFWGLENLSLIPGTVGASPVQNIGAYGVEVMDYIDSVRTIDIETGKERQFLSAECAFSYRDSIFKRPEYKKFIIVAVTFKLSLNSRPQTSYKDITQFFLAKGNTSPSQKEIRDAVIEIRMGKFPDLTKTGTAGSFWKNPIIEKAEFERLKLLFPELPSFPSGNKIKIPLAWILDHVCKLKGYTIGTAGLFNKQPLVVVAEHGSSSEAVKALSAQISALVKEKTGIVIEREVEWVG